MHYKARVQTNSPQMSWRNCIRCIPTRLMNHSPMLSLLYPLVWRKRKTTELEGRKTEITKQVNTHFAVRAAIINADSRWVKAAIPQKKTRSLFARHKISHHQRDTKSTHQTSQRSPGTKRDCKKPSRIGQSTHLWIGANLLGTTGFLAKMEVRWLKSSLSCRRLTPHIWPLPRGKKLSDRARGSWMVQQYQSQAIHQSGL